MRSHAYSRARAAAVWSVGLLLTGLLLYAVLLHALSYLPPPAYQVPLRETAAVPGRAVPAAERLDLNAAAYADLIALPGIGPKLAASILEMRETLGGFHYVEELLQISGFGQGKLQAIYDRIEVQQRSEPE